MKRVILLLLSLTLLLACVPTPDIEAVVNRTDDALEKAVLTPAAAPYRFDAPSRWEETFDAHGREVRIETDIEVPTAEQFPILTVRQLSLTEDTVTAFVQAFVPGDWRIRENEYSRAELQEDLKHAADGVYRVVDGHEFWEPDEAEMQRLQALIEQAPLEDTFVPLSADRLTFPIKTVPLTDSEGTVWYLFAKSGPYSRMTLNRHRDGIVQTENIVLQGEAIPNESPHALTNLHITEADAIAQGDALIAALGRTDFCAAQVQKAREVQSYTHAEYSEGYQLVYVRTLSGTVPCFYGDSKNPSFLNIDEETETFAPSWQQETVRMYITEDGVQSIAWSSPKETVTVANENVQLLSFNEIQYRIKKLLEYSVGTGDENAPVLVRRIVLTTSIAQMPDQGEEAFYVPTWAVFLTTEQELSLNLDIRVLLFNAIDGSYIHKSA